MMDAMHIGALTVGGQSCEFDLDPSCTWNEMKKNILAAFGYEEAPGLIAKFGEDAYLELLTLVADGKTLEVEVGTDAVVSLGIKPGTIFTAVIGDPEELENKLINSPLLAALYRMSPYDILEQPAMCRELVNKLNADELTPKQLAVLAEHIMPAIKDFALHVEGCRVVQHILSTTDCDPQISTIMQDLVDIYEDLYQSPHGNHVLQKAIADGPRASLVSMVLKVVGRAATVARHCYGCRVLERLIEFCDEPQLRCVLQEIVADASSLCRHPYGNYVVQHVLERVEWCRKVILQEMLKSEGGMPYLASHRTASHVVQKALEHCDTVGQHQIVRALLLGQGDGSLLRVATSRYGSFVIEQLKGLSIDCSTIVAAVEAGLRSSQETLRSTQHGCRVAERFGLSDLQAVADMVPGADVAQ